MVHIIENKERRTSLIAKNPGGGFLRARAVRAPARRILALHGPARCDINARPVATLPRKQKGNGNYFGRVTRVQKSLARVRLGDYRNE